METQGNQWKQKHRFGKNIETGKHAQRPEVIDSLSTRGPMKHMVEQMGRNLCGKLTWPNQTGFLRETSVTLVQLLYWQFGFVVWWFRGGKLHLPSRSRASNPPIQSTN